MGRWPGGGSGWPCKAKDEPGPNPVSGRTLMAPMERAPGSAVSRAATWSRKGARRSGAVFRPPPIGRPKVRAESGWKPGLVALSRAKLRTSSPAAIRTTTASDTSATTSRSRNRRLDLAAVPPRPSSARAARSPAPEPWMAGTMPNSSPLNRERPTANRNIRTSNRASAMRGMLFAPSRDSQASRTPARTRPAAPPASDTSALSERSCAAMRPRLAPSAIRRANSFCRAAPRARRQVGDVGAGHEDQQPHGGHDDIEGLLRFVHESVAKRVTRGPPAAIQRRVRPLQPRTDARHFGARLLQRHAGLQTRDHRQHARRSGVRIVGVQPERQPDVRQGIEHREAGRKNAQDLAGLVPQADALPQNRLVAAEAPLPEAVTQEDEVGVSRPVLVRLEGAADGGLDAQQGKHSGGNPLGAQFLGLDMPIGATREVDAQIHHLGHALEGPVLLPGRQVRRRHIHAAGFERRTLVPDHHQAFRIAIRERLPQRGIHDAEDRRAGASAEGQHQHGDNGDRRRFCEGAHTVPKILNNRVHGLSG